MAKIKAQQWDVEYIVGSHDYARLLNGELWGDTGLVFNEYGEMFHTTDFFETYTVDSSRNNFSGGLSFINRTNGFISSAGKMLKTQDGGLTWDTIQEKSTISSQGGIIRFVNDSVGITCDYRYLGGESITKDGG